MELLGTGSTFARKGDREAMIPVLADSPDAATGLGQQAAELLRLNTLLVKLDDG